MHAAVRVSDMAALAESNHPAQGGSESAFSAHGVLRAEARAVKNRNEGVTLPVLCCRASGCCCCCCKRIHPRDLALVPARFASALCGHMQEREAAIYSAAGATAVFEAMRACRRPAIGHHMSLDLAFCLAAFAGPLPAAWLSYKLLVQQWFPGAHHSIAWQLFSNRCQRKCGSPAPGDKLCRASVRPSAAFGLPRKACARGEHGRAACPVHAAVRFLSQPAPLCGGLVCSPGGIVSERA